VNCVVASEYQAAGDVGEPWPSQRTLEIDPPAIPSPAPEVSSENERTQDDQAAQRIAAQQAERRASSEYAVRMELEAQTQAETTSSLSCYAAA